MKQRLVRLKHRYPVAFGLAAGVFLAAGAAFAGFVIYSLTAGGSTTGQFANATTIDAITISNNGTAPSLDKGAAVTVPVTLTNNDPSAAHSLNTISSTVTTKNQAGTDNTATCASHLTVSGTVGMTQSIPAGGTFNSTYTLTADATTPSSCAAGTWKVAFTGTST